jgi:hypothetical protein
MTLKAVKSPKTKPAATPAGSSLAASASLFRLGQALGSAGPVEKIDLAVDWFGRYMGELYCGATEGSSSLQSDLVIQAITPHMQMLREVIHMIPVEHQVFKVSSRDPNVVTTPALRTLFVPNVSMSGRTVDRKSIPSLVRDLWLCPDIDSRLAALHLLSNRALVVASAHPTPALKLFMNLAAWDAVAECQGSGREIAILEAANLQVATFNPYEATDVATRHGTMNTLNSLLMKRKKSTHSYMEIQTASMLNADFLGLLDKLTSAPGAVIIFMRRLARLEAEEAITAPNKNSNSLATFERLRALLPTYRSIIEVASGLGMTFHNALDQVETALAAGQTYVHPQDLPELARE